MPRPAPPPAPSSGAHGAPGVVLVHGTRMAGAYWAGLCAALGDRFRVTAVDLPGHGARRGEPFTHREALDTILRALAACAGGAGLLVGHSLGGFLAMDAAAEAPARCRGLALVGCSALARGPLTLPYRLALGLLPLFSDERLTRWNDALLRRLYPPALVEPQIAAGYGFRAVPAAWRAVLGRDHARSLASFPSPILVVNGARDRLFRSGERRFLRTLPATTRLAVIEGAGHLVNLDQPARFQAVIRAFAEDVARGPGG